MQSIIKISFFIYLLLSHLFIYLGISTRRQRSDSFGLQVKLPPFTTSLKVEAIPLSALPKDTRELAGLNPTVTNLMLNVKQGSCEYQLFSLLV